MLSFVLRSKLCYARCCPVQTGGTFIWLRCWTSTSSITARKTCEHSHTPVTMRYVRVSTLITRSHTSRRSQCKTKCSGQKNNTYGRRLSSSESHRHTRTRQFTARRPAPFLGSRSALPRQNKKNNNYNLATKPSAVLPCPEPGTISGCRYSRPLPRDIAKLGSRVDTFVSNDEDTTSGIAGSTGGVKELSKATTQFIGDVAISEARGEKEK